MTEPSVQEIVSDVVTDILHPEFGSIYQRPDGEAYLAYQAGLAEGRAESIRSKKMAAAKKTAEKAPEIRDEMDSIDAMNEQHDKVYGSYPESFPVSKTEAAVYGLIMTGFVGFLGWMTWVGIKEDQKREEESRELMADMEAKRKARDAWFEEQRKNGKVVLETKDGSYLAIATEAYAQAEIRKKALW